MWALIALIALQMLGLGVSLARHGEPREGNYNFFTTLLSCAISWWLIYMAGMLDKFIK